MDRGKGYDAALAANPFDTYMARWEARHVREIVATLFPRKIPRYLDFACGTGRLTAIVAPMALESVGVDVSASMLAIAARKVPSATLVQGDLTSVDLQLGLFDLVTSFRFFGNAQRELRTAALRALNSLLRMGGHLLVNNHRNPIAVAHLITRVREGGAHMDLTHRRFKRILEASGFAIAEARPIGVWQYRGKLMVAAGTDPVREERLERMFGGGMWVPLAPDAVILARKVGEARRA